MIDLQYNQFDFYTLLFAIVNRNKNMNWCEEEFARYIGAKYAIFVSDFRTAMKMCLFDANRGIALIPEFRFNDYSDLGGDILSCDVNENTLNSQLEPFPYNNKRDYSVVLQNMFGVEDSKKIPDVKIISDCTQVCRRYMGQSHDYQIYPFRYDGVISSIGGAFITTDDKNSIIRLRGFRDAQIRTDISIKNLTFKLLAHLLYGYSDKLCKLFDKLSTSKNGHNPFAMQARYIIYRLEKLDDINYRSMALGWAIEDMIRALCPNIVYTPDFNKNCTFFYFPVFIEDKKVKEIFTSMLTYRHIECESELGTETRGGFKTSKKLADSLVYLPCRDVRLISDYLQKMRDIFLRLKRFDT